jgi:thiamine biosynthesis lipoprotein
MKPKSLVICGIAALALCLSATSSTALRERTYAFHYENVLGTSLELKVGAASPEDAGRAEQAALGEIEREAKILSSWDPDSEFSRWERTRGEAVRVSQELAEVLGLFDQWRGRTGGALDASAEAVTRVWKQAEARQEPPTDADLAAAVEAVRRRHWQLDAANHTATHLDATPAGAELFHQELHRGSRGGRGAVGRRRAARGSQYWRRPGSTRRGQRTGGCGRP